MASSPSESRHPTRIGRFETSEETAHKVADAIEGHVAASDVAVDLFEAGGGRWEVAIYVSATADEAPVRAAVAAAAGAATAEALRFEPVQTVDWVRKSLAGLAPVAAGRFIVHGAHDRFGIPPNRIGIEIEAGLAFGTGHHGTTRGCLLALDRLRKSLGKPRRRPPSGRTNRGLRVLDVGTGSGVLGIAAARSLHARVLATDIDPDAVRIARANAALNRAAPMMSFVRTDGVAMAGGRGGAAFDLVFANILLRPLQRLAAPLRQRVAPGGRVVLSGLLSAQANAAIAAYRPLALERRITLDGWATLVFVRRMA